jgi:transposase-like protein
MPKTRKSHPPSLKAKVAVEAIKAHKTAAQIAQMFGVHPTQVGGWIRGSLNSGQCLNPRDCTTTLRAHSASSLTAVGVRNRR